MREKNALGTIRIVMIITGILTVLLGIYAVVRPFRTFLSIGWLLGALLLINGIELVILSLSKEKKDMGGCILGILEGIGGAFLLFSGIQRFLTDIAVIYLVAGCILVYGIFQIVGGAKVLKVSKGKGILGIVCGVLSIIITLMVCNHPLLTMISMGYIIAFSILMQGINMIVAAINIGEVDNQ